MIEQSMFTPLHRCMYMKNDGIRKCSFMVPEYNFFSFFCVRGFSCFFGIFKLQASVWLSVCLYLLMKTFHKEPIKKKNKLAWNFSSIQKKRNANVYMM